jgi:hypothetical protein
LAAQYYGVYLPPSPVATPTPNYSYTPTMSFYDFSGTQVSQQQNYSMTQNAQQLALEQKRLDAEAQARREAEQAQHAQETAVAYANQQTAEARIFYANQTAAAQSTAMIATAAVQSTATRYQQLMDENSTAVAYAATQNMAPTSIIWTQQAVQMIWTVQAGEAKQVELAVKRQEMKNWMDAYLPWAILICVSIAAAWGFNKFVLTRPFARDEHGAVPLIQRQTSAGVVIVRPELLETGVMRIDNDGQIHRYQPMDGKEQSDITRRAQAVDAIRALPTPYAATAKGIIGGEFGRSSSARVVINPTPSMGPALDEAEQNFLGDANNA